MKRIYLKDPHGRPLYKYMVPEGEIDPIRHYAYILKGVRSISAGLIQSLAIADMYGAWAWGRNDDGELGTGVLDVNGESPFSLKNESVPTAIYGNHLFRSVSAGSYWPTSNAYSLAIDTNGHGWCWGHNHRGQLGDDSTVDRSIPVAVAERAFGLKEHTFSHISAGGRHSLAIGLNGKAWGWGYGAFGQLGNNKNENRSTPVSVYGEHIFCHISAGGYAYSLAINTSGQAWAWGNGQVYGLLGNNGEIDFSTPVAVCGGHTFCSISGGFAHSLAIDNDGEAWGWGNNSYGQLGDNSVTPRSTPVAVCGGHTFCSISGGCVHSLALDNDGQAWGWGWGVSGQLGDNSTTNRSTPVAVCGGHTFCSISGGFAHSLAIDNDGEAWGWGDNSYGQLGDNTTTDRSTPVAICNI